jgi:hypothetical protein
MSLYEYVPHPHIERRKAAGPVKVRDQRPADTPFARFNSWLSLKITLLVGTMVCAYVFALIALISLPSAISSGNLTVIVAWISSNFIQLVLLPIIIVGQNVQAKAADKRSEQTYKDAEAVLAEALKIQEHLAAQDKALEEQRENLAHQEKVLRQLVQGMGTGKAASADGA